MDPPEPIAQRPHHPIPPAFPSPLPSTPTSPGATLPTNSPSSPTFSYASYEPDTISVSPRPSASTSTPDRDSRRSRARQELSSAFYEELEDIPAQLAEERRMSVRRLRVPLSGESLRSISTTGRGRGRGIGPRSSRDSRAMGDWQKEQREWEERADAVTAKVGESEAKDIECGMVPSRREAGDQINHNVNVNYHGNRGMEAILGDRNLSWNMGDDVGGLDNDTTDSRGNWQKFLAWVLTWKGILITIYSLNIVAWGGMLFLLLINAAPAMCRPTCNDINSSRRIWVEVDSQILNALFCVTGFGLLPWRFRDLYLLMRYRIHGDTEAWETLRGVHHTWDTWVGKPWKVDFVVHLYCCNTYFQTVLAGLMWGMTRYNRPAAGTGAAVTAACLVAMAGGWVEWREGKKVKKARAARIADGGESGHAGGIRMSQMSRATEGDREEERAVKSTEAGLI